MRRNGLRRLPHAGEVYTDHLVPLLAGELPERAERPDAGVRDQDVDLAELGYANCHRRIQLFLRADIGLHRNPASVMSLNEPDSLVEVVLGRELVGNGRQLVNDIGDDHVGALARARHRVSPSLPSCAPGDEGHFAIEHSHR